ncbi:MAG: alpha/beta hydrolase [bacterium]|nr:alpha/beta hydrolase [bacterium]
MRINYALVGDPEKQKLIFIHGWPMRFLNYEPMSLNPVLEVLTKHFYVFAITPPGMLHSGPPSIDWDQSKTTQIIAELTDELDWKESIVLGQSNGGGIAAAYASDFPEKVQTLVLVDSTTTERADTRLNTYFKMLDVFSVYKKILLSSVTPFEAKKCLVYQIHNAANRYLTKEEVPKYQFVLRKQNLVSVDYATIESPTILIWGVDDEITPISAADQILNVVDDVELVIVPGSHTVLYDDPGLVIGELLKVLEKSDGGMEKL